MTKKREKTILAYSASNNSRNSGSGFSHKEILFKTVRIETYAIFFRASGRKTKNKNSTHGTRATRMGVSGYGSFFCLWAIHARSARGSMFTEPWAMPPTAGAMKIEQGVVYNPTIHHGYLLETNRHPGRRQPWPLPPPIGPPRPFRSRERIDRAMGDAP